MVTDADGGSLSDAPRLHVGVSAFRPRCSPCEAWREHGVVHVLDGALRTACSRVDGLGSVVRRLADHVLSQSALGGGTSTAMRARSDAGADAAFVATRSPLARRRLVARPPSAERRQIAQLAPHLSTWPRVGGRALFEFCIREAVPRCKNHVVQIFMHARLSRPPSRGSAPWSIAAGRGCMWVSCRHHARFRFFSRCEPPVTNARFCQQNGQDSLHTRRRQLDNEREVHLLAGGAMWWVLSARELGAFASCGGKVRGLRRASAFLFPARRDAHARPMHPRNLQTLARMLLRVAAPPPPQTELHLINA